MPWVCRGGKRYYYRTVRKGRRAVRQYVGTGPAAERVAAADELRKVQRLRDARELRDEHEQLIRAQAALVRFCGATDILVRAALVAAGYRQHARCTWRLPRGRPPST
jgi:hypothetical protein